MQYAGVGFKQPNVIIRNADLRPAFHDGFRVQTFDIEIKLACAVFDGGQKRGVGRPEVDNARTVKDALFGEGMPVIPKRLARSTRGT
jgi:hypothetical protein